jgi:hypothetical protein
MAVVNSEDEAEILRYLYFKYGTARIQLGRWNEIAEELPEETTDGTPDEPPELPPSETPNPEPTNAILHIGFHDKFIEGEYLTLYGK